MKIGRGQASIREIFGPSISVTFKASNFKFGIQLGFGEELAKKKTFTTKIGGGPG